MLGDRLTVCGDRQRTLLSEVASRATSLPVGFRLQANALEGQKRFAISQVKCSCRLRLHGGLPVLTPS